MSNTPADIRPAKRPPKSHCVRGHDLATVGFNWNRNTYQTPGVVYLTRRCAKCAVEDVQRCIARRKRKKKRAA